MNSEELKKVIVEKLDYVTLEQLEDTGESYKLGIEEITDDENIIKSLEEKSIEELDTSSFYYKDGSDDEKLFMISYTESLDVILIHLVNMNNGEVKLSSINI